MDATFSLYRQNFALFAGVVALLAVPQTIVNMALAALITQPALSQTTFMQPGGAQNALGLYAGTSGVEVLLGIVFGMLVTGALAQVISQRFLGLPTSVVRAYTSVGPGPFLRLILALVVGTAIGIFGMFLLFLGIALGTALLAQIATAAGVLFAIGSGLAAAVLIFWVPVHFIFVPQVIVLERSGTFNAFRRSWQLVSGYFWRVLGLTLLALILVGIISGILGGFARVLSLGQPVAAAGLGGVLGILVQPVEWAAFTLLYYDQRIRKEGFDLEFAARRNMQEAWPPSYSQ
jgi:hypothetical protein